MNDIHEILLSTLEKYYKPNLNYLNVDNCKNTNSIIFHDISRLNFDQYLCRNDSKAIKLYKNLLLFILEKIPVKYIQGMSEVSLVILIVMFKNVFKKTDMNFITSYNDNFIFISDYENKFFKEFCKKNSYLCEKTEKIITEILKSKFSLICDNNFEKYKENYYWVRTILKKKGIYLSKFDYIRHLNHILTFYTRICENEYVIFYIFNIILNNNIHIIFSLLVFMYEYTYLKTNSNKDERKISVIPDNFNYKLNQIKANFIEIQETKGLLYYLFLCYD